MGFGISILVISFFFMLLGGALFLNSDSPISEDFVVCTGWHALCTSSPDCKMEGAFASCDCLSVNEPHIVATSEIQDEAIKLWTLARCTDQTPCMLDEAPVCQAIQDGTYEVNQMRYPWVSTYSYRGWCELMKQEMVACDPSVPGYRGDRYWAICDAAPCVENLNPANWNKPLTCQCRVDQVPFVAFGSCTGENGGIMSSMPLWAWDFERNNYTFPMPGYEFVKSACAGFWSDRVGK